ncbi:gamma-glutamyl-gamma-aminobutyrate hydrolase family protein [Amygdalobacter nucleatus]|uniref:Peptidase C26 n=1 Tax=Amygdalobacter nucleatus TaxID=3029274 RepID=A0A133YHE5_9FIRM|nr:gamma-glutamyl-gamma-aminobutyrate hydrolase family protein [Amygdalobacter nucleatus]KXB42611.1 peptidase C26 [Amygdalobacter nucleatus]MDF0486180.1 gamma-glutamyl-gamma-aminobutyrate hydrolase family protein [Amygdalobacter nucleatus]
MLRIAVSGSLHKDEEGYNLAYANNAYIEALAKQNAVPLIIPCVSDEISSATFDPKQQGTDRLISYYQAALSGMDALLLTGGHDLDPRFYNEEPKANLSSTLLERDISEFCLLKVALEMKMPILAICRGLQLINVYFGGSLYQDLAERKEHTFMHVQRSAPYKSWHQIELAKDSELARICQTETLQVNSLHHQAIKELAANLTAVAWAKDGLIEAFTLDNYPFLLALQWHPEFLQATDMKMQAIFAAFLQEAQIYKQQ